MITPDALVRRPSSLSCTASAQSSVRRLLPSCSRDAVRISFLMPHIELDAYDACRPLRTAIHAVSVPQVGEQMRERGGRAWDARCTKPPKLFHECEQVAPSVRELAKSSGTDVKRLSAVDTVLAIR